jgi:hypothetical protein
MPTTRKKSFALKIGADVYRAFQAAAASDLRSVNAQIVVLLCEAAERRTPEPRTS